MILKKPIIEIAGAPAPDNCRLAFHRVCQNQRADEVVRGDLTNAGAVVAIATTAVCKTDFRGSVLAS
jgi:hypothetical protein